MIYLLSLPVCLVILLGQGSVCSVKVTLPIITASGHSPFHNTTAKSKPALSFQILLMSTSTKNLTVSFHHLVHHFLQEIPLHRSELQGLYQSIHSFISIHLSILPLKQCIKDETGGIWGTLCSTACTNLKKENKSQCH